MVIRLIFLVALFLAPTLSALECYVAVDGSDADPGTRAKPFATFERARDEVRKLGHDDKRRRGGVTIWLRGGDYVRTNALELTVADSGTQESPIVWQAAKGETVRLLGGRRLTGFKAVADTAILSRLDEAARGHVVEINLRALGIAVFGELKSRGFGRSALAHCELFYDHRPMTLARWPNEGEFAKIAGYPTGHTDEHGGQLGELPGGFLYAGDRPRRWQDTGDLWVHGYWAYDWANSYEKVASLDIGQRLVKTAPPHGHYGYRKDQRFYFLNVLEELDQPGEWFLDRKTGVLYFWPPDPVNVAADVSPRQGKATGSRALTSAATETLISLLGQPLVKLADVSHVTLRSLTLEATRGNAIEIRGGASNRVAGCTIRNLGNAGVAITGGLGHGVTSCEIVDTGDGGVALNGGDRKTLTADGHFVESCHFARQGRWSKCYVPAVLMEGVGLRASHNLIHDHPHCAILFNGNDHLIELNEIHHIALETGDVGAIYAGRDYTYRGNRIRYNYIHHTGGVGMGSVGVYMDDCVSGTEIFGNIFYKVHEAMFMGGGRDHRVENNIFVDCDPAVSMDARGLDTTPVWRNMVNDYMRGRLAQVPAALYRERYRALKTLDRYFGSPEGPAITGEAFKGVPPEGNVVARNICVGKWLDARWHATPQMLRLENNLTNGDPRFTNVIRDGARAKDFALKRDSPAWKLGFQRIPVEQIGPE